MIARARLDRDPTDGLRHRGPKPPQTVTFQVGCRPAFFQNSPATHAVYRVGGVVYGLAGDFGGVSMGPDKDGTNYTWVGQEVTITQAEADTFHTMAQNVACHMKYTLLTRNCYSPVVAALQDLLNNHGEDADALKAPLTNMLEQLREHNLGAGTQRTAEDAKKNQ